MIYASGSSCYSQPFKLLQSELNFPSWTSLNPNLAERYLHARYLNKTIKSLWFGCMLNTTDIISCDGKNLRSCVVCSETCRNEHLTNEICVCWMLSVCDISLDVQTCVFVLGCCVDLVPAPESERLKKLFLTAFNTVLHLDLNTLINLIHVWFLLLWWYNIHARRFQHT